MLIVRNLRPDPTWQDQLRQELPLIRALGLCAVALLCFASLGQRTSAPDWYRLSAPDGVLVATPMASEAACRTSVEKTGQTCESNPGLFVADQALLAP